MPIIIINPYDINVYIKNSSKNIIIQKMFNFHREGGYQIARWWIIGKISIFKIFKY